MILAQQPERAPRAGRRGQGVREFRVDELDQRLAPFFLPHIEQPGAGGVAKLHAAFAGEVEIDVIVRQQHGRQRLVILRLVLFQPEDFWRGVARQHGIAGQFDQPGGPAKFLLELLALLRRRGVTPQLGRADDLALFVERHKAVLLPAHADGFHLIFALAELL